MNPNQRVQVTKVLNHYVACTSQCALYNDDWSVPIKTATVLNAYKTLITELKSINIDFSNLSISDAITLGCSKSNIPGYWYIPLYLYEVIPDGTHLYSPRYDGAGVDVIVREGHNISDDNRAGFLAYCFKVTA